MQAAPGGRGGHQSSRRGMAQDGLARLVADIPAPTAVPRRPWRSGRSALRVGRHPRQPPGELCSSWWSKPAARTGNCIMEMNVTGCSPALARGRQGDDVREEVVDRQHRHRTPRSSSSDDRRLRRLKKGAGRTDPDAALEVAGQGIRVDAIGVGDVVTNILNDAFDDGPGFLASTAGRRHRPAAEPMEIAEIVAFLASERASYILGSVVMADGGISVQIK